MKRVLLTNKRGEERNYGVLIAAIVAIVAIVGLIILFNKGGAQGAAVDKSDLEATQEAYGLASAAGVRCGQCSATLDSTGVWDSSNCPDIDSGTVGGYTPNQALKYCCKASCSGIGAPRCGDYCMRAGTQAGWGYSAGTSNQLNGE